MTEIPYQIYAENKFFSVIDTFKSNFESKQDHGAQFCAYKNGELILDLQGVLTQVFIIVYSMRFRVFF